MRHILLVVLAALAFSCQKTGESVNATSNLIGTYKMNASGYSLLFGRNTNQTGAGTLKVVRAGNTGNIYEVTEDYSGYYRKYLVAIDGNKLTIQNNSTEPLQINNKDYAGELSGTGEATEDTKTIRIRTTTYVSSSDMQYRKVIDITGIR